MANVTVYNTQGQETGSMEVPDALFDVEVKTALVHEAVTAGFANARTVIAHTKDRSDVAGSGKKPWKQKGTGRARHGQRQSPLWKGGGITFGPRNIRNFALKINRKARRKALAMVLTDKRISGRLIIVDSLVLDEAKTKALSLILDTLPSAGKKTLVVVEMENRNVGQAAQNLQGVEVFPVNALNLIALLRLDYVVMTKTALEQAIELFRR